eukprot:343374_1
MSSFYYVILLFLFRRHFNPIKITILLLLYLPSRSASTPVPTLAPSNTNYFECTVTAPCDNIHCIDDTHCSVICNAMHSCQMTQIYAPNNANLTVSCDYDYACDQTEIHGQATGGLSVHCTTGKSCVKPSINCPQNGICHVDAISLHNWFSPHFVINATDMISGSVQIQSARDSIIYCPGNGNECIISCTEKGCFQSTFYSQPDTGVLNITAYGANALTSSRIYCPSSNHTCSINVHTSDSNVLSNANIYSMNGLQAISIACDATNDTNLCYDVSNPPKIYCKENWGAFCDLSLNTTTGKWQCIDVDTAQMCDSNALDGYYGSNFICNEPSDCRDYHLFCKDETNCVVDCDVKDYACSNAVIHGPRNGNLTVECRYKRSCARTNIIGPQNGSLTVNCAGQFRSCMYAYIQCPIRGLCTVDVAPSLRDDFYSIGLEINATGMMDGGLVVEDTRSTTVHCPGNENECIVRCGDYGCADTTLYTQHDTARLDITASGMESLKSSIIYCPTNGVCSIQTTASNSANDTLSNAGIYAVDGLDDVSFSCTYTNDASECYEIDNPPQLFCKENYESSCEISLESGYNEWQCADTAVDICDNSTLDGSYGDTFVCNPSCDDVFCSPNKDCSVLCNTYDGCRDSTIIGPQNGSLDVQCLERQSCRDTLIIGPQNGDLFVNCSARNGLNCYNSDIQCPIHGDCHVQGGAYVPSDNDNPAKLLTINATNTIYGSLLVESVRKSTVYCPGNDNRCTVACAGDYSCFESIFYTQPNTIALDITAHGIAALKSTEIWCPSLSGNCSVELNGSGADTLSDSIVYAANGFDDVSVSCTYPQGYAVDETDCYDVLNPPRLQCTRNYTVACNMMLDGGTLQCADGLSVCEDIDTPNGFYGSYFVCEDSMSGTPTAHDVCYRIVCTDNRDCHVRCSGIRGCNTNTIIGPTNGNLKVECTDEWSCRRSEIIGPNTGNLSIEAVGRRTMYQATVRCPTYGDCTIRSINDTVASEELTQLRIYAATGLKDVSLECATEVCYTYPPRLFCQPDFSEWCDIIVKSTQTLDEWECDNGDIASEMCFWTATPTDGPTLQPTNAPTTVSPTVYPSVGPSAYPTTPPTIHPTINPTVAPTVYPTAAPTIYPTGYPTIGPTVNPTLRPTTEAPSIFPTVSPARNPSILVPPSQPTKSRQSEERVDDISTTIVEPMDGTESSASESNENQSMMILITVLVAVVTLLVVALIVVAYCWGRNKALQKGLHEQNVGTSVRESMDTAGQIHHMMDTSGNGITPMMPLPIGATMPLPTMGMDNMMTLMNMGINPQNTREGAGGDMNTNKVWHNAYAVSSLSDAFSTNDGGEEAKEETRDGTEMVVSNGTSEETPDGNDNGISEDNGVTPGLYRNGSEFEVMGDDHETVDTPGEAN